MVRLEPDTLSPRLDWHPITRYGKKAGDLLAAFELLSVSGKVYLYAIVYISITICALRDMYYCGGHTIDRE